jgi:DNA-binding transcriptional MerR regulator
MVMRGFKISEVAKAAKVNIETIKYYEKRGLLSKPSRTESGYRVFSNAAVEDIQFIKRAKDIGFTLQEIKHLLYLIKQDDYFPTEEMYQFATTKVKEIEEKIIQLQNFKSLLELVTKLPDSSLPLQKNQCPILTGIIKGGASGE